MTVPEEEATANYVPAAAVTRRWRALSGITGRKGRVGGPSKSGVKNLGSTEVLLLKLLGLRAGEVSGIPSAAVKCVDIRKNTSGEGDLLAWP